MLADCNRVARALALLFSGDCSGGANEVGSARPKIWTSPPMSVLLQTAARLTPLKAALVQRRVRVFDKNKGTRIGLEKFINLAREHCKLTTQDAGLFAPSTPCATRSNIGSGKRQTPLRSAWRLHHVYAAAD